MTPLSTFPPCPASLTPAHLARSAVIYLRQSTPGQVQYNTGSTARQYSQHDLARAWGWPAERILVVDDDLGVSGAKMGGRVGFAHVLTWIAAGRVGAIFTVHEDRLARNLLEFAQLLHACEQAQVLLVIDGRVKDLHQAGDRLLTVMMGVFAEHENRDRRHKLQTSRLAKIQVHHCASGIPPIGYDAPVQDTLPARRRRSWGPHWEQSADPLVVQAVTAIFAEFRLAGTVGAVVRALRQQGLGIPCRLMRGPQYGTVVFQPPTYHRVRQLLRNPCYTDAFVYLRARRTATFAPLGESRGTVPVTRPPQEWLVVREHHAPYLSWEEFWSNQARMLANSNVRGNTPRNGAALMGSLLVCGHCGYRMQVNYGRHGQTVALGGYRCPPAKDTGRWECLNVSARVVEPPVMAEILRTLAGLTEQAVQDAITQEQAARNQQCHLHVHELQQAEAAATLAERRFKAVDPANTLVARQLEGEYEAALQRCAQLRFTQSQAAPAPDPSEEETDVASLLAVAADVQRVWAHPAVTNEERKELLRALLERIVVRETTPGVMELTLHWHGGRTSTVQGYRKTGIKYHVLEYWQTGMTARDIAATLNAEGLRTVRGRLWSAKIVEGVLYLNARSTARWQAVQARIRELHGQGLRCQAIADQLNAEGLRVLTNEPWQDNTVGIELQMLGLPKPSRRQEAGRSGTPRATNTAP